MGLNFCTASRLTKSCKTLHTCFLKGWRMFRAPSQALRIDLGPWMSEQGRKSTDVCQVAKSVKFVKSSLLPARRNSITPSASRQGPWRLRRAMYIQKRRRAKSLINKKSNILSQFDPQQEHLHPNGFCRIGSKLQRSLTPNTGSTKALVGLKLTNDKTKLQLYTWDRYVNPPYNQKAIAAPEASCLSNMIRVVPLAPSDPRGFCIA